MRCFNYFICKNSQPVFTRSAGAEGGFAVCRRNATRRSEHRDDSPWPPPMSLQEFSPRVFTEQSWCKRTGGGGAVEVCVYVTDQAPPCDSRMRLRPQRKEWHRTPELKHATWCSDSSSLLISLLLLSLSRSHQAVGGYPIGSLRVVAVPSHLFTFLPVSQPSLSYPWGKCVPCQFY